jgi:hypothetical protein
MAQVLHGCSASVKNNRSNGLALGCVMPKQSSSLRAGQLAPLLSKAPNAAGLIALASEDHGQGRMDQGMWLREAKMYPTNDARLPFANSHLNNRTGPFGTNALGALKQRGRWP